MSFCDVGDVDGEVLGETCWMWVGDCVGSMLDFFVNIILFYAESSQHT